MRFICRFTLVALLTASLLRLPTIAAADKPLGMIVEARSARLEAMSAAAGATVYPGDAVATDSNGALRLRVGHSQLYLMSNTEVRFAQINEFTQATLDRGTIGFSASPEDRFQIETPVGVIQPVQGLAYGQVAITGPEEMIISAYQGDLILAYGNDVHTIAAGSSYKASLEPGPPPGQKYGVVPALNKHVVIKLIVIAALGTILFFTWQELSESPSRFSD